MGVSHRKCQKTTTSAALSSASNIDSGAPSRAGADDDASEDASYASLLGIAISVCSKVDLFY